MPETDPAAQAATAGLMPEVRAPSDTPLTAGSKGKLAALLGTSNAALGAPMALEEFEAELDAFSAEGDAMLRRDEPPGDADAGSEAWLPDSIPDPVGIAALQLLSRALDAVEGGRDAVTRGGIVVVEAPAATWCEPLAAAWSAALGAAEPGSEAGSNRQPIKQRLRAPRRRTWRLLCADGGKVTGDRSLTGGTAADGIAEALRETAGVVGISHAPDRLLSRDLTRAADYRATVPAPSSDLLRRVAELTTASTGTLDVTDAAAARVSPADLWLALRHGQSADDYLRRVLALSAPMRAERPVMTLDDLHGAEEAVAWGKSLAGDLAAYARGHLPWSAVDRGAVLAGPPGTGKTTFARALAGTTGLPLIATSFSAWDTASKNGHLSDLQKAMREEFDRARRESPCLLFIDEIDSIPSRGAGGRHDDYWRPVVNCLLECLDGLSGREGVVVVAATNHPEHLDPALVRSGRLDRIIRITRPNAEALAAILRTHLREGDLPAADLRPVAERAQRARATGADIETWVRGARRRARDAGRPMALDDLLAEICGPEPEPLPPELERRVALHEAGHALVAVLRLPGWLTSVELGRHEGAHGRVEVEAPVEDAPTPSTLRAQLLYLLGGRAAEEVVLGEPSTGAGGSKASDLARASALATNAIASFGLGGRLLWHAEPVEVGSAAALHPGVADEAEALLREAYAEATGLLRKHTGALQAIAAALVARRSLTGAEVGDVVAASTDCARRPA